MRNEIGYWGVQGECEQFIYLFNKHERCNIIESAASRPIPKLNLLN